MTQKTLVTRRTALRGGAAAAGLLGAGTKLGSARTDEHCYYQIDFVAGDPLVTLGAEDVEEAFYGQQNRLIQYLHGDESGPTRRDMWINSLDPEIRQCITAEPIQVTNGTASVEFTVADGCERTFSLGVYSLPDGEFSFEVQQELLASATGTFGPGTHELTIDTLPQIVCPQSLNPYTQFARLSGDPVVSDRSLFDYTSVAVSESGDTVVIGARSGILSIPGSVSVFVRTNGMWTQQADLVPDETGGSTDYSHSFGGSVAISDSGDTVIVGSDWENSSSGAVYIFTSSNSSWSQQARLTPDDAASGAHFGDAVAVSGGTAVIGAYADSEASRNAGAVYVFSRTQEDWTQEAKLIPDDVTSRDYFGYHVAVSDGTILAGTYARDHLDDNSGAHVFVRTDGSWTHQAELTTPDVDGYLSVALSGDTAVVGSLGTSYAGNASGAVYIFTRTDRMWAQQTELTADDAAAGDTFGASVALGDETVIVGAWNNTVVTNQAGGSTTAVSQAGSAYVFTRANGRWNQRAILTADDPVPRDYVGWSVAVSGSGDTVLTNVSRDRDEGAQSGSAYVFGR